MNVISEASWSELEAKLNELGGWYYTGRYAVYLLAQKYLGEKPEYKALDIMLEQPEFMKSELKKIGVEEDFEVEGHQVSFPDGDFKADEFEQIGNAWALDSELLRDIYTAQVDELLQKEELTDAEEKQLDKKTARIELLDRIIAVKKVGKPFNK
ncbi:MAG: hypothetical protein LBT37_04565 [Lactobacillaceae bacterium]|jgi:hypothetical protein|nr:hypothetical protein [Lactobacillaceae bacterium]